MDYPVETTPRNPAIGNSNQKIATGLKRRFFLVLGFIMVVFGAIGIVLPVIPTTPFLLLASACFTRSSQKVYTWLHESPRFKNFFEKKGLTMRGKVTVLAWAWLVLVLGFVLTPVDWVKILLVVIGSVKTIVFLFVIKTVPGRQHSGEVAPLPNPESSMETPAPTRS
jgi:uncharacterized membrane protein YbaN (DUF454 family)